MKKNKTYKCPFCGQGKMVSQIIDYELNTTSGIKVTIPDLEIDICDVCNEKIFGYESALKLSEKKRNANQIIIDLKGRELKNFPI